MGKELFQIWQCHAIIVATLYTCVKSMKKCFCSSVVLHVRHFLSSSQRGRVDRAVAVLQEDQSGFALTRQPKYTSVLCSSAASHPAWTTPACIVLPLPFWVQRATAAAADRNRPEEVKKPSDTAASDESPLQDEIRISAGTAGDKEQSNGAASHLLIVLSPFITWGEKEMLFLQTVCGGKRSMRSGASVSPPPPPLIPAWIPLWSHCADRGALPVRRRSFIYLTVFHLRTATNLHQREIHFVYPIGVI